MAIIVIEKSNEQLTRRRSVSCPENSFELRLNSGVYQLPWDHYR